MNEDFGLPASTEVAVPPEGGKWVDAGQRQAERRAMIPALYKTNHERLACELALRMEAPEVIFPRYGYEPDAAIALMDSPAFTALLARIGTEIRENGLSFRMKAKAISEELLQDAFDIATDPLQSAAVRADLIKWAAKVAGNEPAPQKGVLEGGGGFNLSITFAGQAPQQVLTAGATLEHQP